MLAPFWNYVISDFIFLKFKDTAHLNFTLKYNVSQAQIWATH